MRRKLAAITGTLAAVAVLAAPAAAKGPKSGLEFLGQAIVPSGTTFAGTRVGGLSSITYDKRRGVYYAVSDDPADVRFYTLRLDVRDGRLSATLRRRHDGCSRPAVSRTRRRASIPRGSR